MRARTAAAAVSNVNNMATEVGKRNQIHEYIGETHNQLRDGYGVYYYPNKFFRYEGEWSKGKKHGHGKFIMADGSFYEGEFKDNEMTGHGFRFWARNQNNYTGNFCCGELQGTGVMKYSDGSVYEGEWWNNKRHGYGVHRMINVGVFEGNFHEHLRHGEGSQLYINGDKYEGDWVRDKRQGHGEERSNDGSIYEGQWRNDMKNGEGTMIHCSGYIYQGLWLNNVPEKLTTKLVICIETPTIDVTQGQSFSIRVECRSDDDDEVIPDNGRELRVLAGFRHIQPKEGTALFDMIEDVEETIISTPFGYDIVPYPLTDQLIELDSLELIKSNTDLTIPETDTEEVSGDETEHIEPTLELEHTMDSINLEGSTAAAAAAAAAAEAAAVEAGTERVGSPVPPPIPTLRTEEGCAVWDPLTLATAPPMYRPFTVLDDEALNVLPSSGSSPQTRRKSRISKDEDGENGLTELIEEEDKVSLKKRLGDERFARPGEYVIMVEDVTNPPFLDRRPQPAFILVKLSALKKQKKVKEPKKNAAKRENFGWDTSKHIAESMARSFND
ncbi:MORN repeat-containing protein 1-like isoform X2 [Tubulanus polymorphus]|uniref:MORN repeat-containing protein 1-like isoform X2 n=1 Tax=Tubulanus polymorphus TaxID=672921 RepID=UPI003DA21377